ncbi:PDZ domain-containing protein [Leptolyngbya sp. 15MV]|nr:PDZ domain-containing protein [Leptolyngbya sp. 15MV]
MDLIERSRAAAKAAEDRGDWLTAQELFVRLSLLTEEEGTFKDDVRREQRRLAMIRLYAPERFWELRNARRNAEIEFNRVHRKTDETGKAEGAQADDNRPLPPYNPIGDDFREKLRGVDRELVRKALAQGFLRHVERTPMEKMLREVIGSVRTLATTEDLKGVFPALGDAARRSAMLETLDELDRRVREMAEPASIGDLDRIMDRLVEANARTLQLPEFVLMHEIGNGGMDALDEFSGIIWPDEMRRFQRTTQGRFFGVGVQIEQDPLQNIRVVTPIEGTPAQRAGIQRDDIIKKVNGNSTVGFTLDQAVDNITGPKGTPVTITVEREVLGEDGQSTRKEIEFRLVRDEVPIQAVTAG